MNAISFGLAESRERQLYKEKFLLKKFLYRLFQVYIVIIGPIFLNSIAILLAQLSLRLLYTEKIEN